MSVVNHTNHGSSAKLSNGTTIQNTCFFNCLTSLTGYTYADLFRIGGFPEESRGRFVDLVAHASYISQLFVSLGITVAFYSGFRVSGETSIRVNRDVFSYFPEPINYDALLPAPTLRIVCSSNHYMTFDWSGAKAVETSQAQAEAEARRAQEMADAAFVAELMREESERVARIERLRREYVERRDAQVAIPTAFTPATPLRSYSIHG